MSASSILTGRTSIRRVYFGFHYQRDIWRLQQVRHHWVTKPDREAAGYFDGSLEEKAKREGDAAIKRLINGGLFGSSVTCILIGSETINRRWVHYEIFRSIETGMGVFGVYVHELADMNKRVDVRGGNPFACLGYGTREGSSKLWPMINYTNAGWMNSDLNEPIDRLAAAYVPATGSFGLSSILRTYDWIGNKGYENFATWVAEAARQAGR